MANISTTDLMNDLNKIRALGYNDRMQENVRNPYVEGSDEAKAYNDGVDAANEQEMETMMECERYGN